MKRSAVLIALVSLFMTGLSSCEDAPATDDIVAKQTEEKSRTGSNDDCADSVRVFVRNKLSGYAIMELSINGIQHDGTILPDSTSAFQVRSEERISAIDINCSIRSLDGSDETIGNLHGTKDIASHGTEAEIDIDAEFLGLDKISFDAGVSGYEEKK